MTECYKGSYTPGTEGETGVEQGDGGSKRSEVGVTVEKTRNRVNSRKTEVPETSTTRETTFQERSREV